MALEVDAPFVSAVGTGENKSRLLRCRRCCCSCWLRSSIFAGLVGAVSAIWLLYQMDSPTCTASPTNGRRAVYADGTTIRATVSNEILLLTGPAVGLKGPPWFPEVGGNSFCNDSETTSCRQFNEFDIQQIKSQGWNAIRLIVVWAGAQPTASGALDAEWLRKFYAILDLCESHGIHVLLDPHQDAVGTANCGEGVPMWFSIMAVGKAIGKALVHEQSRLAPNLPVLAFENGSCSADDTASWASYAGDPEYNTRNPCCLLNNQRGWSRIQFTSQAQDTLTFLFGGNGRAYYVDYLRLLAAAVKNKPAAVALELFNEPLPIRPFTVRAMFETWMEAYDAVQAEAPGLLVGLMTIGEGGIPWYQTVPFLPLSFQSWARKQCHLFFAWHWYHNPKSMEASIQNALWYSQHWSLPVILTEYQDCEISELARAHGMGTFWWQWSRYCDRQPENVFGACITGYNGLGPNGPCGGSTLEELGIEPNYSGMPVMPFFPALIATNVADSLPHLSSVLWNNQTGHYFLYT